MLPVNTKEKMALHLVSQPSDLSTAGVKDKELFIHNTLHRGSTDRATVEGREGEGGKKRREGKHERKEKKEKKSGGMEGERERVIRGTLYQGEDSALLIHQHRQGPRKSMVVKQ